MHTDNMLPGFACSVVFLLGTGFLFQVCQHSLLIEQVYELCLTCVLLNRFLCSQVQHKHTHLPDTSSLIGMKETDV